MELQQLKYFKTVAEIGKISEAAQALFISAPALSTSISRLEKELGCKLFDRTNNRITLNQQGKILLRYADRVFTELDCAKAELQQSIRQQGHHVSLATVASTQWVDMITTFTQEHPGFTLLCTSVRRQELLAGLSTQHSFLLGAENDIPIQYLEKLESTFLFEDRPMLMVSAAHPLARETSVELSQLTGEAIYLPMPDYPLYDNLVTLFAENGVPFPEGNGYSHLSLQHMVVGGMGISFATAHSARFRDLSLRYIPIENSTPWACKLFWRKDHTFTEDERLFQNFLLRYYGQA